MSHLVLNKLISNFGVLASGHTAEFFFLFLQGHVLYTGLYTASKHSEKAW